MHVKLLEPMEIPAFFIANTPIDNQLKQLLANRFQKIVFQFLMDENGGLTLVAYGAQKKNQCFGPPVELECSDRQPLKIDTSVYLGNFEVGKDEEMELLKEAERKPDGKEYIHIVPKSIKDRRIEFEVTASSKASSAERIAVVLNPCPPGNSE